MWLWGLVGLWGCLDEERVSFFLLREDEASSSSRSALVSLLSHLHLSRARDAPDVLQHDLGAARHAVRAAQALPLYRDAVDRGAQVLARDGRGRSAAARERGVVTVPVAASRAARGRREVLRRRGERRGRAGGRLGGVEVLGCWLFGLVVGRERGERGREV